MNITPKMWTWIPLGLGVLLVVLAGFLTHNWHEANGLMNGTQNELWHVLNAFNIWDATPWVGEDSTAISYYLWSNYWPPGFYLMSWPFMAVMGASHHSLVMSNLLHLGVLLFAVYGLAERLRGPAAGMWAMALVLTYPSITGNLVRYEPSVALAAWVSLGALMLIRTRGFLDWRWTLAFAAVSSVGLMVDRLSYGIFLFVPAVAEMWRGLRLGAVSDRIRNLGIAALVVVVCCGYWHLQFVQNHLQEVLSQGGAGNIDSEGSYTELRDPAALKTWLFYGSVLLDAQAGLIPGLLGLLGVVAWLRRPAGADRVIAWVILSAVLVLTLVQKKQVYYSMPMLGCLAVLSAVLLVDWGRAGVWVGVFSLFVGAHQIGLQLLERPLVPGPIGRAVGAPVFADSWVDRDYPQARPALWLDLPTDAVIEALPPGEVLLFSESPVWTETYATLHFRERMAERRVWQVVGNPQRAVETLHRASAFLQVSSGQSGGWPTASQVEDALIHDGSDSSQWPLVETVESAEKRFVRTRVFDWSGGESGGEVVLWVSRSIVEQTR